MPGVQFITSGDMADPEDIELVNKWKEDKSFLLIHAILNNATINEINKIIETNTSESMFSFKPSIKTFINNANKDGVTALHAAVICGNLPVVKQLIKWKANVNVLINVEGRCYSPLHFAIANLARHSDSEDNLSGFSEILRQLLLAENINCSIQGSLGRTPLHTAVHFGQHQAIESLLKMEDNGLNAVTHELDGQKTPLHNCAFTGDLTACELLYINGADMFAKDANGHTPFHNSIFKGGHPDVAKFLFDQIIMISEEQANILIDLMVDVLVELNKNPHAEFLIKTDDLLKTHFLTKEIYPQILKKASGRLQAVDKIKLKEHEHSISDMPLPLAPDCIPCPISISSEELASTHLSAELPTANKGSKSTSNASLLSEIRNREDNPFAGLRPVRKKQEKPSQRPLPEIPQPESSDTDDDWETDPEPITPSRKQDEEFLTSDDRKTFAQHLAEQLQGRRKHITGNEDAQNVSPNTGARRMVR